MKVIYTILALFTAIVIGGSYYVYQNLDSLMGEGTQIATDNTSITVPTGSRDRVKIISPFWLRDGVGSESYRQLNTMVNGHITVNADMSVPAQRQLRVPVYKSLINFYRNESHDAKERAYALNLLNLIFLLGFDAETLQSGLADDATFSEEFAKNLEYAKSLRKKDDGAPGAMFGTGDAAMNYAAQKTMAFINNKALELYPSSYALLRSNINEVQAEWILYTNFFTGKKYKTAAHIIQDKFGDAYYDDFQAKIDEHIEKNTLYEDTYAASAEINIMYAQAFLWYRYELVRDNKALAKEARRILDQSLIYHDRMVTDTDEYNTGRLFYGYVLSALGKSRIAQTNVYSKEENEKLMKQAEETLVKVFKTSKNKQMAYWLKNLPPRGWMKLELDRLASRNADIQSFVKSF